MTVELTVDDWIEKARSAERGEAWPQALAFWTRALPLCDDVSRGFMDEEEQRCLAGIARCEHEVAVDAELASVAKRVLSVPTMVTFGSDDCDLHTVSVWQILAALRLAHRMGRRDASK